MNRYRELYSELQDFRRQQPFGFTRFFGNMPVNVYANNGTVIQQTPALVLHEQVHQQLASLTPVQIEKYSNDLARIMNLFVRWLQYTNRVRGWRGQAPGKENQDPNTQGGAVTTRNAARENLRSEIIESLKTDIEWVQALKINHPEWWQHYTDAKTKRHVDNIIGWLPYFESQNVPPGYNNLIGAKALKLLANLYERVHKHPTQLLPIHQRGLDEQVIAIRPHGQPRDETELENQPPQTRGSNIYHRRRSYFAS